MKNHLKAIIAAAGLTIATMSPAFAAPVFTGGLVNVTIFDVLNNNTVTVQLPLAVAANLCDIDINVLAADLADGGATCTAVAGSMAGNKNK